MRTLLTLISIFLLIGCNEKGSLVEATFTPGLSTYHFIENIKIVSGNNQVGEANSVLSPILIKVTTRDSQPIRNEAIKVNIRSGNGKILNQHFLTDDEGFIEVNWLLGSNVGLQEIEISTLKTTTQVFATSTPPKTSEFKTCNLKAVPISSTKIKVEFSIPNYFKKFTLLRDGISIFSTSNLETKEYIDTVPFSGSHYEYKCQALSHLDEVTEDTNTSDGVTLITSPPVFAGIERALVSDDTASKILWKPFSGTGTFPAYYIVYYSQGSSLNFTEANSIKVANNVNTSEVNITDLLKDGTYTFAVRACAYNDLCESNTTTTTLTLFKDTSPPEVQFDFNIIRNKAELSSLGISPTSPGKAWTVNISASDNDAIYNFKIWRKKSSLQNDNPSKNPEIKCSDETQSDCLLYEGLPANFTLSDKIVNTDALEFHHYLLEVSDGSGNIITQKKTFNTHYPTKVATGENHTCALFNNHNVSCWGNGSRGQLGYPGRNNKTAQEAEYIEIIDPILDEGATRVVDLQASSNRTCVVLDNGRMKCWGQARWLVSYPVISYYNDPSVSGWGVVTYICKNGTVYGKCAAGIYNNYYYNKSLDHQATYDIIESTYSTPKDISSFIIHPDEKVYTTNGLKLSDNISCAQVDGDSENKNKLKCWGKPFYWSRYDYAADSNASKHYGHHQTSCLLGTDPNPPRSPQGGYSKIKFLGPAWYLWENWQRCATSYPLPENNYFVTTNGLEDYTIINFSVGNRHSCAVYEHNVDKTHSVRCWGGEDTDSTGSVQNLNLLLGIGGRYYGDGGPKLDNFVPILAQDPLNPSDYLSEKIIDIASSASGSCVLIAPTENSSETMNKIRCWGKNDYGQYGIGSSLVMNPTTRSTTNNSAPTVAPPALTGSINFIKLYATVNAHSYCGLDDKGRIYCWGENNGGILGLGHTNSIGKNEGITDAVPIATEAISLSMGLNHACSLLLSGEIQCWGENSSKKLGTEVYNNLLTPTEQAIVNLSIYQ